MYPIICTKILPTDTALMEQVFRLRHQVYVHERDFLCSKQYYKGLEHDTYDEHSIHFAALNQYGEAVGTVRLIPSMEHSTQLDEHAHKLKIPAEHTLFPYVEISRFCISKQYMRRFILGHSPTHNYLNPIAFAFYRAIVDECDALGVENMFALVEKPLAMMLKRSGLKLHVVGKEIDMYGAVSPYKFSVDEQREPIARYFQAQENLEPVRSRTY